MQQNTIETLPKGSASCDGQLINDLAAPSLAPRASLLSLLVSGKESLINFDAAEVAHVQQVFADITRERKQRKELKLVMHTGLAGILSLREQGPPVLSEQARFHHKIEADFVLKRMEGDLMYCSPDLADTHSMAAHVRDRFLSACNDAYETLASNPAHVDLIYLTALELLP